MEGKYIKKCAEVAVAQSQKRCVLAEREMKEEIEVGNKTFILHFDNI